MRLGVLPCRAHLNSQLRPCLLARLHAPPCRPLLPHPQSSPPHYEYTSSILSDLDTDKPISLDSLRVLASRESVTEPPQVRWWGRRHVRVPGASRASGVPGAAAWHAVWPRRVGPRVAALPPLLPPPFAVLHQVFQRRRGAARGAPHLVLPPPLPLAEGPPKGDCQVQEERRAGAQRHSVPAARSVQYVRPCPHPTTPWCTATHPPTTHPPHTH